MTAAERERLVEACRLIGETVGQLIAKQFELPTKVLPQPTVEPRVSGVAVKTEAKPGMLTQSEAADYLGISTRTVFALIKEGRIKVARIGRAVRIRREELERIAAEGC